MKKKLDWQIEFHKFIDENRFKGFAWGSWDCCKFANACIKAMTGEDLIPKELSWKNEEEALKSIKDYGGTLKNSIKKASKKKNLLEIDLDHLQIGDLVVYKEESQLVGIYDGNFVLTPTDNKLGVVKNANILSAWRIDG